MDKQTINVTTITKFGEGSGAVGLPGDFTPPSRFIRSAYFVSTTPKDLERNAAILQGFRILSQSDIPTGAVVDPKEGIMTKRYILQLWIQKIKYIISNTMIISLFNHLKLMIIKTKQK